MWIGVILGAAMVSAAWFVDVRGWMDLVRKQSEVIDLQRGVIRQLRGER